MFVFYPCHRPARVRHAQARKCSVMRSNIRCVLLLQQVLLLCAPDGPAGLLFLLPRSDTVGHLAPETAMEQSILNITGGSCESQLQPHVLPAVYICPAVEAFSCGMRYSAPPVPRGQPAGR